MPNLKAHKVITNLCKKGFKTKENDHTYLVLYVEGKKTAIYTKISHGEIEISKSLVSKMAKQIGLSTLDFIDFATCKMSEEEYLEVISNYLNK